MLSSFTAVLDLFPSSAELGRLVGKDDNTVRKWRLRDSIPSDLWPDIVRVANERGHAEVTMDLLAELRKRRFDKDEAAA